MAILQPPSDREDEFLGMEEKHDNAEEYLEALAMLEQQGRSPAPISVIARKLKVKPPSAVQMLQRLARAGFATYLPREGVRLTPKGRRVGERMVRNGRLMEVFIHGTLGLPGDLHVAHAVEHSMSIRFAEALCRLLGHPRRCPHDYPIPRGRCCTVVPTT